MSVVDVAIKARQAGISTLPVEGKIPAIKWKDRQAQLPSEAEIQQDYAGANGSLGLGLICGAVSGNLEVIDHDLAGEKYSAWEALVEAEAPGLINRLAIQQTPSGGYHVVYRCKKIQTEGSRKLAMKQISVNGPGEHPYNGKKYRSIEFQGQHFIQPVVIETRGEGGYVVAAPTDRYTIIQPGENGDFHNPPNITAEEREILVRCAKAFNEYRAGEEVLGYRPGQAKNGLRPGEDFNNRCNSILDLLLQHEWQTWGNNNNGKLHLTRPGKAKGVSATLFHGKVLYVFSSNAAPFETEKAYSPFAVYALLKHVGDFSKAACQLKKEGYGERSVTKGASEPSSESFQAIEPLDIFGDDDLTGRPEWPAGAIPQVLEKFARDAAERMGVDTSVIAFASVLVATIAIPDGFLVQPKLYDTDWVERPCLWGAIIGEPGEKKSPALSAAVKPLKDYDRARYLTYKDELVEYERQAKVPTNDTHLEYEPEKPVLRRKIVDDITVEAIRGVLQDNPDGVGVVKDELTGWLTSFDMYRNSQNKGKDRADYCELFQGGGKHFDRVQHGFIYVPNWSASILGGIQPGPVQRLMGNITDDGMINRFLVVHCDRSTRGEDRKPDQIAVFAYHMLIENLCELKPLEGRQVFLFTPEAVKCRENIVKYCELIKSLPTTASALRGHLNKVEAMFCRMALVFHVVDAITESGFLSEHVSGRTAAMVQRLFLEYLLPQSLRFYRDTLNSQAETEDEARWIAGYLLAHHKDSISTSELRQNYRKVRKNADKLYRAIRVLEDSGWLIPEHIVQTKRWPTRWTVNPKVHEIFGERAKKEQERREVERKKIQAAIRMQQKTSTGGK